MNEYNFDLRLQLFLKGSISSNVNYEHTNYYEDQQLAQNMFTTMILNRNSHTPMNNSSQFFQRLQTKMAANK